MESRLVFEQAVIVIGILASAEIGFRVARRRARSVPPAHSAQASTVQAAVLGMLGLLLAFMLSMAQSRYSGRAAMITEEANAVATAYLRAELVPEPHGSASRRLLRSYVDERCRYDAVQADAGLIRASDSHTAALQMQMWQHAATAGRAYPESNVVALYIEAVNAVFDHEAARATAIAGGLPLSLVGLLILVAMLANGITGYCCGLGQKRDALSLLIVPLMIASACSVVVDLDRPRAGIIRVSDYAMERLQHEMAADLLAGAGPIAR